MNRIIEAFTREHDKVTGVDEIIMVVVGLPIGLLVLGIVLILIYPILKKLNE